MIAFIDIRKNALIQNGGVRRDEEAMATPMSDSEGADLSDADM